MSGLNRSTRWLPIAAAIAIVASPALGQAGSALGSWDTVADTPMGKFTAKLTIAQAGGAYTIDMKEAAPAGDGGAAPMESKISDVVVNGNSFSFKRALTTPQGPMVLTYAGKVDGDKLTAEATSEFGAMPITGTRSKP